MKSYYSVNEFAALSGVEASTLRYWDRIGLFKPLNRDPENNYRHYSLAQITTLNFISTLSDLGIPLKTIAAIRSKRNPEEFLMLLERRERTLDAELLKLHECSSVIHTREVLIKNGLKANVNEISVVYREMEWPAVLWPRNEYNEGDTFIEPLTTHINQRKELRINLSYPVGGRYDSMESFLLAPGRPDNFFSVDPIGTNVRKRGDYMIGFTRGYYGELGDLPERMAAYAADNNLQVSGPVYLMYPHDEACLEEPEQYLGQVMVAVSRHRRRKII